MANWDEDSPQLRKNLARVLEEIAREAELRAAPTIEAARQWQGRVMEGLGVPNERYVGAFRGSVAWKMFK